MCLTSPPGFLQGGRPGKACVGPRVPPEGGSGTEDPGSEARAHGEGLAPESLPPTGQEPAAGGGGGRRGRGSRPQAGRTPALSLQSPRPASHPRPRLTKGTSPPGLASLGPQTGFAGVAPWAVPGEGRPARPQSWGTAGGSELSRTVSELGGEGEGGWSAQRAPPHPGQRQVMAFRVRDSRPRGVWPRLPSGERQDRGRHL